LYNSRKNKFYKRPHDVVDGVERVLCYRCRNMKPLSDFPPRDPKTNKLRTWCKECAREYNKSYDKARILRLRESVFNHLGQTECQNCGCEIHDILELHHLGGGGKEERRIHNGWYKMMDAILKIPKEEAVTKYRVLCTVCHPSQHIFEEYGVSLHKISFLRGNKYIVKRERVV